MKEEYTVRVAKENEFETIGKLLVKVYSQLEGFPGVDEQPDYYKMLENVGALTAKPGVELLVAVSSDGVPGGAVVFFNDMQFYGSGGSATREKNASGFRLLAVDPQLRGKGLGKLLTYECIRKARANHHENLVIHTTRSMMTAWKMYESIGFKRADDLDFMQGALPVFGFRFALDNN
jgi:GNAT superfamily N-acetyltransferase